MPLPLRQSPIIAADSEHPITALCTVALFRQRDEDQINTGDQSRGTPRSRKWS